MEQDLLPAVEKTNGINLDNYFLYNRDFNCSVYIHKKFANTHKANNKKSDLKADNRKCHRSQPTENKDTNCKKCTKGNRSVLEQTIKFAKNLIPLTIPPSRDKSPVYYTIKTSRISNKKSKKESSIEQDIVYDKRRSEAVTRTHTREKTRNRREITKDSTSQSSESNTLDDVNCNNSLSYTLSGISEKKCLKQEINHNIKRNDLKKLVISDSFEAIAAEKVSEGGGIKIHLMNESDKKSLTDSIRIPVLNTLKECLDQIYNNEIKTNISGIERCVLSNAYKLDIIIEKLAHIEKKLEADIEGKYISRKQMKDKTSTLEKLGEDVDEHDISCSEEESRHPTDVESANNVVEYFVKGKKISKLGCGEVGVVKTSASVGVKTELPSRLPTRFCWTDTAMNID